MSAEDYLQPLASERRPAEDRMRDESRKLPALLEFYGVGKGQRVADLMSSRGYLAGALAEVIGETGLVYAHNSPQLLARFKGDSPIRKRITDHGLNNVREVVSDLESLPLPANGLDAVFSFMFYHDTVWVGTGRAAMNRSVYAALKPGGIFAVIDHHAPIGAGTSLAESHHRIERAVVVAEVTAAGFVLEDESGLLENSADSMERLVFDKAVRDRTHKFVLKFRKP